MHQPRVSDFVFFSSNLQLLGRDGSSARPANAIQELATTLIHSEDAPSTKAFRRALFDPRARLVRAQYFLERVDSLSKKGRLDEHAELWRVTCEEWRWVSASQFVKEQLDSTATKIFPENAQAAVDRTLRAIDEELFPFLEGRSGLLRKAGAEQASSSTAQTPEPPILSTPAELFALIKLEDAAASIEGLHDWAEEFAPLLKKCDPRFGDHLLRTFCKHLQDRLDSSAQKSSQKAIADALWSALSKLEEISNSSLAVHDLLSLAYLLRAVSGPADPFELRPVAKSLNRSLAHDPLNRSARDALDQVLETPKRLLSELDKVRIEPFTRKMVEQQFLKLDADLAKNDEYEQSKEHRAISVHRRAAAIREIAWRLELDPHDSAVIAALELLAASMVIAHSGDEIEGVGAQDAAGFAARVKKVTLEHDSSLAGLPWSKLEPALDKAPFPIVETLANILPARPPKPLEEIASAFHLPDSQRQTSTLEVGQPISQEKAILITWMFSARDIFLKTCAITGLVLLIYGGGATLLGAWTKSHGNRLYESVHGAASAGDDRELLEKATDFLAFVKETDPRRSQVEQLRAAGLLNEVLRLKREGQKDQALALLTRFGETASSNSNGSAEGGGAQ